MKAYYVIYVVIALATALLSSCSSSAVTVRTYQTDSDDGLGLGIPSYSTCVRNGIYIGEVLIYPTRSGCDHDFHWWWDRCEYAGECAGPPYYLGVRVFSSITDVTETKGMLKARSVTITDTQGKRLFDASDTGNTMCSTCNCAGSAEVRIPLGDSVGFEKGAVFNARVLATYPNGAEVELEDTFKAVGYRIKKDWVSGAMGCSKYPVRKPLADDEMKSADE